MSKESSFHKFTRNLFTRNVEGHADSCSRIRKRDGLLFRGDEIGVVDHDGRIRKKEGRIFQGDEVGRVRGKTATGKDGLIFRGRELGFIDTNGVVCKKEGLLFKGERIGSLHGHDRSAALGFYVLKFQEIVAKCEQLQAEFDGDTEKGTYLWRIQRLQKQVSTARALGDVPRLLKKLKEMEYRCNRALDRNLSIKRALCLKLEGLGDSSDWRDSGLKMKQYQKDWKATGPVPGPVSKALWARFRAATTGYYQKCKHYFDSQDKERKSNGIKKQALCRQAETLSHSTEWRNTAQEFKRLQAQWKQIGPVPKEISREIWGRFSGAKAVFYGNRKRYFERLELEKKGNLFQKKDICLQAERLSTSTDWKDAAARFRQLQSDWKAIGPVPKESSQSIWRRFSSARQCFYENRSRYFEQKSRERIRKQQLWKDGLRCSIGNLETSIDADVKKRMVLENQLANVFPGAKHRKSTPGCENV